MQSLRQRNLEGACNMSEYVVHYHHERNHQGLGNKLIDSIVPDRGQGRIRRVHDSVARNVSFVGPAVE